MVRDGELTILVGLVQLREVDDYGAGQGDLVEGLCTTGRPTVVHFVAADARISGDLVLMMEVDRSATREARGADRMGWSRCHGRDRAKKLAVKKIATQGWVLAMKKITDGWFMGTMKPEKICRSSGDDGDCRKAAEILEVKGA